MIGVRPETDLLQRSVRRLLADVAARPMSPDEAWRAAAEMGLPGLCSEDGGGDMEDVVAVMVELGRAASKLPVLEAVVANMFVPGLFEPGRRISLAFGRLGGDAGAGSAVCEDRLVTGLIRLVEGGALADEFLVLSDTGLLCSISASGAGVEVTQTPALLSGMTDLRLQKAPARTCEISPERLRDMVDIVRLGLCARALGAAERGFELAVAHAGMRHQFGQAIGAFQAIQHKLADSHIALEACRLKLLAAARAYDRDGEGWRVLTASCVGFAATALRKVARETQHTLGAIGFSEEHNAPSLFRHVHSDVVRYGGGVRARMALGQAVLHGGSGSLGHLLAPGGETVPEFRARLRQWLEANWRPEDQAALQGRPFEDRNWDMAFVQRLGRDGWTTLSWPETADGMAATAFEQLAFSEEMLKAGAPEHPLICACRILAPAIIQYGTEALQTAMLPGLRAGRFTGCLGYSEPNAGSDLASLLTRAERVGEEYVINGQKTWTTDGARATHMILAARTHPDHALKRRGISLFVVPMDSAGITVRPMDAMYGHKFCDVFFDGVRLPAAWRLGDENEGWAVLAGALASERIAMGALVLRLRCLLEEIVTACRASEAEPAGELVLERIGQLTCELAVAHHLVLKSLDAPANEMNSLVAAGMAKIFSGELAQRICETAADILGGTALLGTDAGDPPAKGDIEQMLRTSIMYVVGGGSNEIQRSIIAQRGLELGR